MFRVWLSTGDAGGRRAGAGRVGARVAYDSRQIVAQTLGSSEQVMTHLFQNPRSGWKHKAWGGAKRNPRLTKRNQTERAKRATAQAMRFTLMKGYRPLSWAFPSHSNDPWGSAPLHPRLYAIAALRGLNASFHCLVQTF